MTTPPQLSGKDLKKSDRVVTPDGRVVAVTWKKLDVIQVEGGQMYMAHELKKAPALSGPS